MKKKFGVIATLVAGSLLMSGCTQIDDGIEAVDVYTQDKLASISVPFEWFKLDEQREPDAPTWKTIKPVELPAVDDTRKSLDEQLERVSKLEEELLNPIKMKGFLSRNRPADVAFNGFDVKGSSPDVLGEVLREVDEVPYQTVSSLTLTGIGANQSGQTILELSLNAVNDSEDFLLYPLELTLNEEGMVSNIKQVKSATVASSTPTPLSEKSEWIEAVHTEFGHLWTEVTNFPEKEDWTTVGEQDLGAWLLLSGIEEPEESQQSVMDWYTANEGNLKLAEITGFLHTDEGASATTKYEVSYPVRDSEEKEEFTIHYDRGLNKIVNIEPGSLFQNTSKGELK